MITELYVFSPSSYVVAEEWNANFHVLYNTVSAHMEAIVDAQAKIAFPNSDLTGVYNAVRAQPNSHPVSISGNSGTVDVYPEQEYFITTALSASQEFVINITESMRNAEARIVFQLREDRSLLPFSVNYDGTLIVNHYNNFVFRSGYYYVMIYETNGVAQVKLIWTGV